MANHQLKRKANRIQYRFYKKLFQINLLTQFWYWVYNFNLRHTGACLRLKLCPRHHLELKMDKLFPAPVNNFSLLSFLTCKGNKLIMKAAQLAILFLFIIFFCGHAISETLPSSMGIWIKLKGNFTKIPRVVGSISKYDFHTSDSENITYYKVKETISRSSFVKISFDEFNKNGFLVNMENSWSDFVLKRVPHSGKYVDNETSEDVIITDATGDPMSGPCCIQYVDKIVEPVIWCTLKKAIIDDDTYTFFPTELVERGFYLIDYKKGGISFSGWNAIQIE